MPRAAAPVVPVAAAPAAAAAAARCPAPAAALAPAAAAAASDVGKNIFAITTWHGLPRASGVARLWSLATKAAWAPFITLAARDDKGAEGSQRRKAATLPRAAPPRRMQTSGRHPVTWWMRLPAGSHPLPAQNRLLAGFVIAASNPLRQHCRESSYHAMSHSGLGAKPELQRRQALPISCALRQRTTLQ